MFLSSAKSDPIVGIKIFVKKRELHIEIQIIFISNKIKVSYSMFDYDIYACLIKTNNLLLKKHSICFLHSRADIALGVFWELKSHQDSMINLVLACASFASPKSLPH